MKVVINRKFGGFGLSQAALYRLLELGFPKEVAEKDEVSENYIVDLSGKPYLIINNEKTFRSNPMVIKVVEELGDAAAGDFCRLKIVDIPFETVMGWYISEYDGMETIKENHMEWA